MRVKLCFTILALALLAIFTVASLARAGWTHCKGTNTMIGMASRAILFLDDTPKHTLELVSHFWSVKCEDFPQMDGARITVYATRDNVAGSGTSAGFSTWETKEGDKIFTKFSHPTEMKLLEGGSWEAPYSGVWEYLGGTGKFKGIKGKGTFTGKLTPEGAAPLKWEADIWLPD